MSDETPDLIESIFYPRDPNICQRAAALWTLLLDFRADCSKMTPDDLSRRCVDICSAVGGVEERIKARRGDEDEETFVPLAEVVSRSPAEADTSNQTASKTKPE